jgi:DNA-directed RNA polymerase specialized sigma24 family protein
MGEDEPSANEMGIYNYQELYNDDMLSVLDAMKSIHREALLLQEAGYSLKEIAEIEYKKGTLKSHNIETIKSRLFLARQFLKKNLTRDGKRKIN